MTDKLLNALKTIKGECEKHANCDNCPMQDMRYVCGLKNTPPEEWSLEKREVYF